MVICGAGASWDSMPGQPGTNAPPLAKDLFAARYESALNEHTLARFAVDKLRQAVESGADVEQELDRMRATADTDAAYHSHLMAVRYYLRDVIGRVDLEWAQRRGGVTNYVRLVGELRDWSFRTKVPVCYVTFNYDLLLDRAMEDQLGLQRGALESYVDPKHVLIKFHGSVNWFRFCPGALQLFDRGPWRPDLIKRASELKASGPITAWGAAWESIGATTQLMATPEPHQEVIIPALSIPLQSKVDAECPQEQVDLLTALIPQIRQILVIGWRGAERHFWDLWLGRVVEDMEIYVCCSSPDLPNGFAENCPRVGIPLHHVSVQPLTFSELVSGKPDTLDDILHYYRS